ncbi:fibronectin type III-like domain-contianing protein [Caulobacter segnis]
MRLEPGERGHIEFTLRRKDLALLNERHQWVVEPGKFKIMVGAGSGRYKADGHLQRGSMIVVSVTLSRRCP